jgi:hypothetical protein
MELCEDDGPCVVCLEDPTSTSCLCMSLCLAHGWIAFLPSSSFLATGMLAGWLAGWLAGSLAGSLAGWLVGSLARWLVGWLVGSLARWLVGWLRVTPPSIRCGKLKDASRTGGWNEETKGRRGDATAVRRCEGRDEGRRALSRNKERSVATRPFAGSNILSWKRVRVCV